MENRKVTKEAMDGLIAVHKTLSLFDSGSGAQSLLQTMGEMPAGRLYDAGRCGVHHRAGVR